MSRGARCVAGCQESTEPGRAYAWHRVRPLKRSQGMEDSIFAERKGLKVEHFGRLSDI